jgi:elongation factor 1-alpha
MHHWNIP